MLTSQTSSYTHLAHQPALDHLRGLAALLVFSFHAIHLLHLHWQARPDLAWLGVITEGHTGVALFFVLSGFLFMQIALQGGSIQYGQFIKNRLLRIAPLFVVVFFIAISIRRNEFQAADWAYLLFSNLGQAPTSGHFITGPAWTIGIEFLFYLIFPFLALFTQQQGGRYLVKLLLLLAFFKLAAWPAIETPHHVYYSTLLGRLDQFVIGMLAAIIWQRSAQHPIWRYSLPVALLLIWSNSYHQALSASYFTAHQQGLFWVFWSFREALGWALLILCWSACAQHLPRWIERPLLHLGQISYSFYLLHAFVLYFIHHSLQTQGWLGQGVINHWMLLSLLALGLTWWLANLSYQTLEIPFLALRRRYRSKT